VVLKPLDLSLEELGWQWNVLPELHPQQVRLAPPRRAVTGELVVEGWTAWERLEGRHQPGRWEEIIAAGVRFHQALAGVPRPSFLDARSSPWAVADRIAWDEQPPGRYAKAVGVHRLIGLRGPVAGLPQCVHGDLTGNVLFERDLVPGVVDFSPYWRPPVFATAVVVADALLYEGAAPSLAEAHRLERGFPQALVRALLFRLISHAIIHGDPADQPAAWLSRPNAIDVAERLVRAG
jgi:uncharacterized protein (TIGR02569 family)